MTWARIWKTWDWQQKALFGLVVSLASLTLIGLLAIALALWQGGEWGWSFRGKKITLQIEDEEEENGEDDDDEDDEDDDDGLHGGRPGDPGGNGGGQVPFDMAVATAIEDLGLGEALMAAAASRALQEASKR